jgi:DedD protein
MGLLSVFSRSTDKAAAPETAADAVEAARTKARRRLIGATVLLGFGVIAFPLIFETQPRPIPVDIPIIVPPRDGAAPLAMPAAGAGASPAKPSAQRPAVIAAPGPVTPAASAPKVANKMPDIFEKAESDKPQASKPVEKKPVAAGPKPDAAPAAATPAAVAAAKAATASAPSGARFVIQVGAFAEDAAVREARSKVEKLGLRTYIQAVDTKDGKRTRVRVGPYASRDEADKAAAQLKATGLTVAVLVL